MESILIVDNIKYYENILLLSMSMIYVSRETSDLIERIWRFLQKNTSAPSRVVKADVIHVAVKEYAKKIGIAKEK